jgi:pimeloyl-ACP methyl ester carboxylesterase
VRILYHSLSAEGRDVASSGVVLIPAGTPPKGGWPVIVWAHGTSGVARRCAPSLMRDVYYGEEGLMPMLRAGFAIVAPDYHGLGTDGVHQYVSKTAQSYDVVYAVPAAQKAVPGLDPRWVVDGHSQGGLAAWAVAELEQQRHDPGYLGAVAVAPATRLNEVLANGPSKAAGFYADYLAWAVAALSPGYEPSEVLTGEPLARYPALTRDGCFYYALASFAGDADAPVMKPGWTTTPAAQRFFAESMIGKPIAGDLLVVAGDADQAVPLWAVRASATAACKAGAKLELKVYPGLDHDPTMENSTPAQLAWIHARFDGQPAGDGCPKVLAGPD